MLIVKFADFDKPFEVLIWLQATFQVAKCLYKMKGLWLRRARKWAAIKEDGYVESNSLP